MASPVYAEGTFLYMKADDSVAITADENNELKYITMTASNGQVVYPQISTDGNTYLPFRYISYESSVSSITKSLGSPGVKSIPFSISSFNLISRHLFASL